MFIQMASNCPVLLGGRVVEGKPTHVTEMGSEAEDTHWNVISQEDWIVSKAVQGKRQM